jgi:methyltransferase-like protein/SAM-dependent methyltransferase
MEDAFSYEVMPYPSKFFLQTHPDRLATLATLFGMKPAPVETCRVLELGCGNGSNLVSHAFNLPGAQFVGVDLAENHIAYARQSARELDLSNVEFHQLDVMQMTAEKFGKFDYIIAHGLYSWIPAFVREKVLALYREMLAENGVGYVSYNAYPGAHHRQMVQKMMSFHTRATTKPMEKVGKAISFLAFLCEHAGEKEVYQIILNQELKRHFEHEAADIFHDDLAEFNQPFYFHEFAAELAKNDLQFLSEAELHALGTQGLAPEAKEFVDSIQDVVEREQYLDFLRGRIFRQTLFCHRAIVLSRDLESSALNDFLVASSLRPISENPEPASQKVEKFGGAKGVGIEIDHPLTKAALAHLGKIYGRAVVFPELLQIARQTLENENFTADWENQFSVAGTIFLQICLGTNLIQLHTFQPEAITEAREKPRVNRLAQWQLRQANNVLTLLNLDIKIEDEVSRHLLKLLDGTRNRNDLLEQMRAFIKAGSEIEDKETLLEDLPDWLEESLTNLARMGMFVS